MGKQTLSTYLKMWLEDYVRPKVRPKTFKSYSQLVKNHVSPALGDIPLARLTTHDVQKFLNSKLVTHSRRTIRYLYAVIRVALGKAVKLGLVSANAAENAEPPRPEQQEIQPFTPEETLRLLVAIRGHRHETLFIAAVSLGLRQGELLGLTWGDVNLEIGTVTVRHALQRVEGKLQLVEPKTKKSRRTIALPAITAHALRILKAQRQETSAHRYVFVTRDGNPLDGCNVTKEFKRVLKLAGLPALRFHDLRHTCASLLIAENVHPRVVMDILGHSQIELTMNTYCHTYPAVRREAAAKMDAILQHENRVSAAAAGRG
jgi:integrase